MLLAQSGGRFGVAYPLRHSLAAEEWRRNPAAVGACRNLLYGGRDDGEPSFRSRHTVEAAGLMRFIGKPFALCATVAAALLGWVAAISGASAQTPASDDRRFPSIDEVRFGAMMHNVEPANDEEGVDLNL